MENGTAARDAIDVRSQPIVGLSQFTESVQAFERTLKELEGVKADRDRLTADVARLQLELTHANDAAVDYARQLDNERSQLAGLLKEVQTNADQRVEEANNRLNVEIANRMHYEAFFSGIKTQFDGFDLPADPVATVRKPNGKKLRGHSSAQAEAAVIVGRDGSITKDDGTLSEGMKDKIAAAFSGDVAVTVVG